MRTLKFVSIAMLSILVMSEDIVSQELFTVTETRQSNIVMKLSNYGLFGFDASSLSFGVQWPRGSSNDYLSAGGIWFGAKKKAAGQSESNKLTVISYNPSSASSWMVPGRISDGKELRQDAIAARKNGLYSSLDFDADGATDKDQANWPIWHNNDNLLPGFDRYFGSLVDAVDERSPAFFPLGPVYLSDEDIVCSYRDTDIDRYEGLPDNLEQLGLPLGIQFDQTLYSWRKGDLADVVILRYVFTNVSDTELEDCFFGSLIDPDISNSANRAFQNDRARAFLADPSLNLALAWSEATMGDADAGLGYVGVALVESPAVDSEGRLRSDKRVYERSEQLGLTSLRVWSPIIEPKEITERYDFMANPLLEGPTVPGDYRILLSTGPFTLMPGESSSVAVAIAMASTASGGDANGSDDDAANLVRVIKAAGDTYYSEVRTTDVAEDRGAELPRPQFSLRPNPARDQVHLALRLSQAGPLQIDIISLAGVRVAELESGVFPTGEFQRDYPLNGLAAGMYYLRVTSGGQTAVQPVAINP